MFDSSDSHFASTSPYPRWAPPVLAPNGVIVLNPAPERPKKQETDSARSFYGNTGFVKAETHGGPQIVVPRDEENGAGDMDDASQPRTPRTPRTPQTPQTPQTPTSPAVRWAGDNSNSAETDANKLPTDFELGASSTSAEGKESKSGAEPDFVPTTEDTQPQEAPSYSTEDPAEFAPGSSPPEEFAPGSLPDYGYSNKNSSSSPHYASGSPPSYAAGSSPNFAPGGSPNYASGGSPHYASGGSPKYAPGSPPTKPPGSPRYAPGSPENSFANGRAMMQAFVPQSPEHAPASSPPDAGDSSQQETAPSSFAAKMMAKMGWKEGEALGKTGQGLTQAIDVYDKQDRAGLGASSAFQRERKAGLHIQTHQKKEEISIDVYVEWVQSDPDQMIPTFDGLRQGYVMEQVQDCDCMGDAKASPTADYDMLATREVAQDIKDSKSAFDHMDRKLMRDAVMRANPWELCSVRGHHIFQNRAAMKMAEMDWLFNFTSRRYSNPVIDDTPSKHDNQFYFADICAGPGGFTEYLYWRRQQSARGWGFTLKGDHDFRLDKFNSTSPHHNFTPCYGQDDTGNVYNNDNMRHFAAKVKKDTEGRGVVLVTADGGDSVDGEFLRQEWIMRRLALCQCCTSVMILRKGGNFICKLFDIFTPFLHDLCYLMSLHFEQTALVKPLTSRPANSERYLVCKGLLQERPQLIEFLLHINGYLDDDKLKERGNRQVSRLLPPDSVPQSWTSYVKEHNVTVGMTQVEYLKETMKFYEDPMLSINDKQVEICKSCVSKWGIPETIQESRKLIYMQAGTRQSTPASEHADDKEMFVYNADIDKPKQDPKGGNRPAAPPVAEVSAQEEVEKKRPGEPSSKGSSGPSGAADESTQKVEVKKKKFVGPDLSSDSVLAALQRRAAAAKELEVEEQEKQRQKMVEEKKERERKLKEREETQKGGEAKKKPPKADKPTPKPTEEKMERKEREPTPPTPPPTQEEEEEQSQEKRERKEKKKSKRHRAEDEEDVKEKKHKKSKKDKERGSESSESRRREGEAEGNGGTSFKIKLKIGSSKDK